MSADRKRPNVAAREPMAESRSAPNRDSDGAFKELWLLTTASGSHYVVARDSCGMWWFGGRNVATAWSCALPPRLWRIERPTPWPPRLGKALLMMAPTSLALADPARVPGGGKVTSPIATLERLNPPMLTEEQEGQCAE